MDSDFKELEEAVMADMRRDYSEKAIDHAMNPRNIGSLPDADGVASVTGPCGDTMEIWLRVRGGNVSDATFWTDGCGSSIASGSIATEIIKGKSLAEAQGITKEDVLSALEGLPEESHHCALLAANTVKEAVRDYLLIKREPWKKAYRKR